MKRNKIFKKRLKLIAVFLIFTIFLLNFNFSPNIFNFQQDKDSSLVMKAHALAPLLIWGGVAAVSYFAGKSFLENVFYIGANMILYAVWVFVSLLMIIAGIVFDWAINPANFAIAVSNNTAIYDGWIIVRDFLNLAFILVLLFTAFCVIFQVSKYGDKKIIITLVIMALLVNFSFPIARFVIDASNVMFYFFVNTLFPQAGISASLGEFSGLVQLFDPNKGGGNWSADGLTVKIIAAIIFTFLFGATLLIIAILFIIRIVVLGVLIVFSPIGFVGSIIPGMKKFADDWWNALFKQAFFAPLMMFMIYLAIKMMDSANKAMTESVNSAVQSNTALDAASKSIIATGATMAMPLVLLWMGMMVSQKFGAIGAAMAQKAGMGAMSKFSGLNAVKRGYKAYQARRQEAQKTGLATRLGTRLASEQDRLRSVVKVPGMKTGAKDAGIRYQRDQSQRVDEEKKRHDVEHRSDNDLRKIANTGNRFEKAAAIMELASRNLATANDLDAVRKDFNSGGEIGQVTRQVEDKMKSYAPDVVFAPPAGASEPEQAEAENQLRSHLKSKKFNINDVNASSLANPEFLQTLFEEKAISRSDIEKLRDKSSAHDNSLTTSLSTLATTKDPTGTRFVFGDHNNEIHRNIQTAHLAQGGKRSSAAQNDEWAEAIYSRANAKTLERIEADSTTGEVEDASFIIGHASPTAFSEGILNMKDPTARSHIIRTARTTPPPIGRNRQTNYNNALRSPQLRNIV